MLDHPQDAYKIAKERQRDFRNSAKNDRFVQPTSGRQQRATSISQAGTLVFLGTGLLVIVSLAWLMG